MGRWRLRTKAIFVYLGTLSLMLAFLGIFSMNGYFMVDPKAAIINRRKMLMEKVAVDRIGLNNAPSLPFPFKSFLKDNGSNNKKTVVQEHNEETNKKLKYTFDVQKYNSNGMWQIPQLSLLPNISLPDLSTIYHGYVEKIQVECKQPARLGKITDGGWEICEEPKYRPTENSLVYSFGIADDFSFDDAVAKKYKAQVHSFDPSTKRKDHSRSDLVKFHDLGIADFTGKTKNGWKMATLTDIKQQLGHSKEDISVLKMDIEEWEWKTLPEILKSRSLGNVKHLLMELHACTGCSTYDPKQTDKEATKDRYILALQVLQQLYDEGFRIFWTHRNKACWFRSKFTNRELSACHEVHMINVH